MMKIDNGIAFCLQQIGLICHRLSKHEIAQDFFAKARDIYERTNTRPMYLAECHHLLGVSFTRQKRYEDALFSLQLAYTLEKQQEVIYQLQHYLTFITAQSIADAKRNLAEQNPQQAKKLLQEVEELLIATYADQYKYYQEKNNADMAKTLAFLGDNYFAQKNFPVALEYYIACLETKLIIYKDSNHPLVKITINDIYRTLKALDKAFDYDWNNYKTIAGKAEMLPRREAITNMFELFAANDFEIIIPAKLLMKISTYYNHQLSDPLTKPLTNAIGNTVFGAAIVPAAARKVEEFKPVAPDRK